MNMKYDYKRVQAINNFCTKGNILKKRIDAEKQETHIN